MEHFSGDRKGCIFLSPCEKRSPGQLDINFVSKTSRASIAPSYPPTVRRDHANLRPRAECNNWYRGGRLPRTLGADGTREYNTSRIIISRDLCLTISGSGGGGGGWRKMKDNFHPSYTTPKTLDLRGTRGDLAADRSTPSSRRISITLLCTYHPRPRQIARNSTIHVGHATGRTTCSRDV